MPLPSNYDKDVFLNCPFDEAYQPFLEAILFAVSSCGFRLRCSLEVQDSGKSRLSKIEQIIRECRFGIHDLSRTELDAVNHLPRFNMPFELGLFLGAQRFGSGLQKKKACLILDVDRYRYQRFLSDIAGQDLSAYDAAQPHQLLACIRDWLQPLAGFHLPGSKRIAQQYQAFQRDKPGFCMRLQLSAHQLSYFDLSTVVRDWLEHDAQMERLFKGVL